MQQHIKADYYMEKMAKGMWNPLQKGKALKQQTWSSSTIPILNNYIKQKVDSAQEEWKKKPKANKGRKRVEWFRKLLERKKMLKGVMVPVTPVSQRHAPVTPPGLGTSHQLPPGFPIKPPGMPGFGPGFGPGSGPSPKPPQQAGGKGCKGSSAVQLVPRIIVPQPKRMPVGDVALQEWMHKQSQLSKRQLQYDAALRRAQERENEQIHDRIIQQSRNMVLLAIEDIQQSTPTHDGGEDEEAILMTGPHRDDDANTGAVSSSSHSESRVVPKRRITKKTSPDGKSTSQNEEK